MKKKYKFKFLYILFYFSKILFYFKNQNGFMFLFMVLVLLYYNNFALSDMNMFAQKSFYFLFKNKIWQQSVLTCS